MSIPALIRLAALPATLLATLSFLVAPAAWAQQAAPPRAVQACAPLLDQHVNRLQDEAPQHLCQYAGKVALVVNTASYCGFTRQYEGLEALYDKYRERGLVVLGFPSNDFGQQEPDGNKEIADFCFNTYGVKFPMFTKSTVRGPSATPLYAALAKATGQEPRWNFHKYLIDRQGRAIASFPSKVEPGDRELMAAIEKALAQGN